MPYHTLLDQLEAQIGTRLDVKLPVLTWLLEWPAEVIFRTRRDADGNSAYKKVYGKLPLVPEMHFGEKVMYMPLKGSRLRRFKGG